MLLINMRKHSKTFQLQFAFFKVVRECRASKSVTISGKKKSRSKLLIRSITVAVNEV